MGKKKRQKEPRAAWGIAAAAAVTAFIAFISVHFFGVMLVAGACMEPALHDGTMVIVAKISEDDSIRRGDIVVADIKDPKTGKGIRVIKRAVGIPGDSVQIKDGELYINGERKKTVEKIREPGKAREEVILGEGEYFLLGDNVNASGDSRMFGPVKKNRIEGICRGRIF